jgi:hypothetical protein
MDFIILRGGFVTARRLPGNPLTGQIAMGLTTLTAAAQPADQRFSRFALMLRSEHQHKYGGVPVTAAAHKRVITINRKMWSCTFLDESGRPSFNALQNYGSSNVAVFYSLCPAVCP